MSEILTAKKLVFRIVTALFVLGLVMIACSLVGTESISLRKAFGAGVEETAVNTDYEIFFHVFVSVEKVF